MAEFMKVARVAEIPSGSVRCFQAGGRAIAIFNLDGELHALDDACSHVGGPLSEGWIENGEVECPWHGARFDIATGEVRCEPANGPIERFAVRVVGEDVEVEV